MDSDNVKKHMENIHKIKRLKYIIEKLTENKIDNKPVKLTYSQATAPKPAPQIDMDGNLVEVQTHKDILQAIDTSKHTMKIKLKQ